MWNLLFSDYIRAKDVLKTKSGVKALKTSPWVNTIAEGMKRCEIEADLVLLIFLCINYLFKNLTVTFRSYAHKLTNTMILYDFSVKAGLSLI